MGRRIAQSSLLLCAAWLTVSMACTRARTPLARDSQDPAHDGRAIAAYYTHEARVLQRKAEEIAEQATAYELLFGPTSDWVTGARLLAQYLEDEAKEKQRLAAHYLKSAGAHTPHADRVSP